MNTFDGKARFGYIWKHPKKSLNRSLERFEKVFFLKYIYKALAAAKEVEIEESAQNM